MSIEVRCRCGNILAVDATHAGREAYCAKCGAAVPNVHETESDRTAEETQVKDPDEAKAPDETGEKKDSSSEIVSGSALFAEAIAAFNELEDRTAEGVGSVGKGKKAG